MLEGSSREGLANHGTMACLELCLLLGSLAAFPSTSPSSPLCLGGVIPFLPLLLCLHGASGETVEWRHAL